MIDLAGTAREQLEALGRRERDEAMCDLNNNYPPSLSAHPSVRAAILSEMQEARKRSLRAATELGEARDQLARLEKALAALNGQ